MKTGLLIFLVFALSFHQSRAQDSSFIRVQFIYGSRPLREYRDAEKKWFGGMLGGHVGIEDDRGEFFSFEKHGRNKIFSGRPTNSIYKEETAEEFWNIMETNGDSLKKTTIVIPVSREQKQKFDSITSAYRRKTPYCYAVFGMRCGASTYEILAQMGILPQYAHLKTCLKIFYPRKLRKRLLHKAEKNGWSILRTKGTDRRKWEKDV